MGYSMDSGGQGTKTDNGLLQRAVDYITGEHFLFQCNVHMQLVQQLKYNNIKIINKINLNMENQLEIIRSASATILNAAGCITIKY